MWLKDIGFNTLYYKNPIFPLALEIIRFYVACGGSKKLKMAYLINLILDSEQSKENFDLGKILTLNLTISCDTLHTFSYFYTVYIYITHIYTY